MDLKKLYKSVIIGDAHVRIGKNGITEAVLKEIERHLELRGAVKVKVLKAALKATGMDRKTIALTVAEKLRAKLIDVRGRTFVLVKEEVKPYSRRKEATRERRGVAVWSRR